MTMSTQAAHSGMKTRTETVRLLCKSIVTRLENQKAISFPVRLRQVIHEEVFGLISPFIFTEEDLRQKALAKMGAQVETLQGSNFTESEQYQAARAVVRRSFGDDELNGLYFQKPVKTVALSVVNYLMRSSHIEDVYETDEDLERLIVDVIRKFDESALH